jgi:hydrogenase nickel incorporation protein HypA/HybF
VHELSICQALLSEVALSAGTRAVTRVTIEIGPLAGIDPAQLAGTFRIFRRGSCAERAELVIESTGLLIECLACGAQSAARPDRLVCPSCDGFRTRIVSGRELRLRRVEFEGN